MRFPSGRRVGVAALAIGLLVLVAAAPAGAAAAAASSGSPSTVATTTTLPAVKQTHAGVRRMLVISIPSVSWEDVDLARLPNLAKFFAQSAVADLSVRGVHRVPALADGYVTIGAGTRSVAHPGDDGECLDAREQFEQGTAREEMARRNGVATSATPDSAILCLSQHEITSRNDRLLFNAKVSRAGRHARSRGRAARGDRECRHDAHTDRRRRLSAVGAARPDRRERDRARGRRHRLAARTRSGRAVRAAPRSRQGRRRVRPDVERTEAEPSGCGGGRQRSRPAPDVRLHAHLRRRTPRCSNTRWPTSTPWWAGS